MLCECNNKNAQLREGRTEREGEGERSGKNHAQCKMFVG